MKRFLIIPGYVRSMSDGQRHYITGSQLIRLYGLRSKDCVIKTDRGEEDPALLPLYPLDNGRYKEYLNEVRVSAYWAYDKARKLELHWRSRDLPNRKVMIDRHVKKQAWILQTWPEIKDVWDRANPHRVHRENVG